MGKIPPLHNLIWQRNAAVQRTMLLLGSGQGTALATDCLLQHRTKPQDRCNLPGNTSTWEKAMLCRRGILVGSPFAFSSVPGGFWRVLVGKKVPHNHVRHFILLQITFTSKSESRPQSKEHTLRQLVETTRGDPGSSKQMDSNWNLKHTCTVQILNWVQQTRFRANSEGRHPLRRLQHFIGRGERCNGSLTLNHSNPNLTYA